MPAPEKDISHKSYKPRMKKRSFGIIAGEGELPETLAKTLRDAGHDVCIVCVKGFAEPSLLSYPDTISLNIAQASHAINFFKSKSVEDIVFIGSVRRPSWFQILKDARAIKFFVKLLFHKKGDSSILDRVKQEFENEGFKVRGIQEIVPDLMAPEGLMGEAIPNEEQYESINIGLKASQEWGKRDRGQAVIVQAKEVIGREGLNGTDALMDRCSPLLHDRRGVLIKTCKPQQDKSMDLPTIGPGTVEKAFQNNIGGIVVQAGASLIVQKEQTLAKANEYQIFIYGVDLNSKEYGE